MADTEFEYGDKRDNLKLVKIDNEDTIAEMVQKINDNFANIAMHGGGPQGEQGDMGLDGVDGMGYSVIVSSPCAFILCDDNWKPINNDSDETFVQLFYYENDKTGEIAINFEDETSSCFAQSYDASSNTRKITFTPSDDFVFKDGKKQKLNFTISYGDMDDIKCSWTLIPIKQ